MDTNNLNLTKFSGFGAKISRKISITKSYSFGLPPAFYKDNDLKDFFYATLYYDKDARVVGIHFLKSKEDGSFKVIRHGTENRESASFVARSFFKSYGLNVSKIRGRYVPKTINQEGIGKIFLIELKESDAVKIQEQEKPAS